MLPTSPSLSSARRLSAAPRESGGPGALFMVFAGGLFGGAPAAAGGLFGGAPAAAGGLFGGAPAAAGGLFGGAPLGFPSRTRSLARALARVRSLGLCSNALIAVHRTTERVREGCAALGPSPRRTHTPERPPRSDERPPKPKSYQLSSTVRSVLVSVAEHRTSMNSMWRVRKQYSLHITLDLSGVCVFHARKRGGTILD